MPSILTTPPTVEPVSLAEAKAHLRVTHSDDDPYISTLIISARRMIERLYDLALVAQSWSMYFDAWPENGIFKLPITPIISIADIKVYGDDDAAATIDPSHYYLDSASKPGRLCLRNGRNFQPPGRRVNGIEVKFVAGFGASAASVPEPIKQALLIIVNDWFASRGDVDAGAIPLSVRSLLAPYASPRLT
jgi:uncharacterized phiE125 gp8 family phage protein